MNQSIKVMVVGLVCALLVGCGGDGTQNSKGVLRLNIGGEPTVLNPILYTDAPSGEVIGLVFSGLFRIDEDLQITPDLCERYTVSKDGKRYRFYLRQNVRWHDGVLFTAADVKFTFDRLLDPKTNTVRRSNFVIDNKPIQFKVIDNFTIEAILPSPFGPFLTRVAMEILPKHLLDGHNINTAAFNRAPIGTGPFKFVEWKSGQYVKLIKNESYYDGVPKLNEVVLKIIPDSNTAMLALKRQEIDQQGILAKDFHRYKKVSFIDIYRWYGLNYTYMGFNMRKPLFAKTKFRQAVAHAINKPALVSAVLQDFGRPAYYPSSPVSWAYPDQNDAPIYPYDPEKSRQLLRELGYVFNSKTKFFEKNGQPLTFTVITNKGNKNREKSAQIIQKFLSNVGVKVEIQLLEWSAFIKILNAPQDPKEFDAVILGWSLGMDPDSYSVWHSSQYPQGFNTIGYANKKVDYLLTKARQLVSPAQRKPVYNDLFIEIAQDLPYVFLYHTETLSGVNQRVKGLSKPGPAGLFNAINQVYLIP